MTQAQKKNNGNPAWVKGGKSPNSRGRPKGISTPISRLRSTLNKLKGLEPDAIENIGKAVRGELETAIGEDGKEVQVPLDKNKLETSKWVITTISNLTRAALAEEQFKADNRGSQNVNEDEDDNKENTKPVFSLTMPE